MNYIIDNTIADPDDATGYVVGSSFLVPATGGEGDWLDKEDQIATWGGATWSFFAPLEGAEYQVTSGPNAGKVFVRTDVVSRRTNLIADGDLELDTGGFPDWTLSEVAGGASAWAAGQVTLDSTTTGDSAKALVVFPVTAYVRYRIVFDIDAVTLSSPDSTANYVLRDLTAAVDIETGVITTAGEVEFTFYSDGPSYSLAIEVVSDAAEPGQVIINSVGCYRVEEIIANGGFTGGTTSWTKPPPPTDCWDYGTNAIDAVIDYPGHTPLPALEQGLSVLTIGQYYRIDFDVTANFARGILSLYFDDVVVGDVDEAGHWSFYFKASATSHTIQFPLTKIGPTTFNLTLDNVSMIAALWVAAPMLKATMAVTATMAIAAARAYNVPVRLPINSGFTAAATVSKPGAMTMTTASGLAANAFKSSIKNGAFTFSAVSGMGSLASTRKDGRFTMAMASGFTLTPADLGFFTVRNAVDSIISLWSYLGCACSDGSCSQIEMEALEPLNAAMQKLHASGQEWGYVSNVAMTISPVGDSTEIILPRNVIHVKRCVFKPAINEAETVFAALPLRPIKTRHECEAFRLSTPTGVWPLSSAESSLTGLVLPLGYFTEAEDARDGSSAPALRLLLAPEFTDDTAWKVDLQVAVGPPRYKCSDILGGTRLQIPERYAETLLMPLARYYALSSRNFTKPELKDSVVAQAAEVLGLLGELQPAQPEAAKEPKRR